MTTPTQPRKVRLNADLSPEVAMALKELAQKQGVSLTEALSRAISTEKVLDEKRRKGGKVLIEQGGGLKVEQIASDGAANERRTEPPQRQPGHRQQIGRDQPIGGRAVGGEQERGGRGGDQCGPEPRQPVVVAAQGERCRRRSIPSARPNRRPRPGGRTAAVDRPGAGAGPG